MSDTGEFALWPPRSVIYGTDFSESSERAGQFAQLLARQFGAELTVVHAFTLSQSAMEMEIGQGAKSAQRKDLEGALAAVARRFGEGVQRVSPVLIEGVPQERIPQLAGENAPGIIVLGTRGRGRLGRGLIGSAADGILRSTNGPSLTVGPHVPDLAAGTAPIKKVFYATDLSPVAALGGAYAAGIAVGFGASLDALHVVRAADLNDPERLDRIRKEFCKALESASPGFAARIAERKQWIEEGSAHARILDHVRDHQVDLLVLSVRKSSNLWLRERLSGAFDIIANAPCPVMTITG